MTGDEQLNNVSAEPVGQQLRRAREKAGLSLAAVADQQHLRVSVIQAIESGDYSKIDTELFLKGYVRAYARQVGLDADSIIRDLDTELEPRRQEREQALQANPLVNIERRRRQKRRAAKLILVLLAAALIGFLAFTYLSTKDSALPATPQPEAEQPEAAEDPAGFQPDSTATAPLIESDEP
ncbi:MAG: helix-turn-helix domain-containing protein, partial [Marinobacter vinifirmus]